MIISLVGAEGIELSTYAGYMIYSHALTIETLHPKFAGHTEFESISLGLESRMLPLHQWPIYKVEVTGIEPAYSNETCFTDKLWCQFHKHFSIYYCSPGKYIIETTSGNVFITGQNQTIIFAFVKLPKHDGFTYQRWCFTF